MANIIQSGYELTKHTMIQRLLQTYAPPTTKGGPDEEQLTPMLRIIFKN